MALNLAVALCVADCSVELIANSDEGQGNMTRESGPAGLVLINAELNWRSMLWGLRRSRSLTADEGEKVDWLMIDQGRFDVQSPRQDAHADARALLVTTTEPAALLSAIDALKQMKELGSWPELVFNRVTDPREGVAVAARMRAAATRLLGKPLTMHFVKEDPQVLCAARTGRAVMLAAPNCAFSRGVARLAVRWISASPARAA